MSGLEFGKVVGVHPGAHAVDVLLLRNGQQLPMVQCLSGMAGTDFGESGFGIPDVKDPQNPYDPKQTKTRDIYAAIGFVSGRPMVLGFMFPQVSQLLFKDISQRLRRDPSDVYTSVTDAGDMEIFHPSGTYFRIATDPAHKDLTGLDLDQQWKIAKNTDKAVHVHLEVHSAGGPAVAVLDIDPSGNVALTNTGNLTATTTGNLDAEITGTAKLKSPAITLDGPVHVTGTLSVDGAATMHGITSTGDVTADGKSLEHHTHSGVQTGSGHTGPPD